MGVACACQRLESEEETISRIFSAMNLSHIEAKSAYSEFLNCINQDIGSIDYFMFQNYTNLIIGENKYKLVHKEYFENLRKLDSSLKKIGSAIIFISKGSKLSKINLLHDHYKRYYVHLKDSSIKQFINDIVELNTDDCVDAFKDYLGYESVRNIKKVYSTKHKRQLKNFIFLNYESVKLKYFHFKNNLSMIQPELDRLNTSIEIDNKELKTSNGFSSTMEKNFKNKCDIVPYKLEEDWSDEKLLKELLELSYDQLSGEYIRNWLYDEFLKEKSFDELCI